ncbi:acetaldehyde dehydrogenase [Virgibacillus natechei]|uniref:Acetaldehyde dehydrogenase n=1 Tax=Virgibacillus natechei TaxID=1216297 RepID=A0ABS4IJR0_9BACI|nr:acetaldehyde dehydrogenase (acetylating) [Virgibacillus natechei]MBP1970676.1 acetaldehyde dehydrogenase [Virgibacillus natechei]UZD12077.1 acetaldehyde dehydrogenase (acetylating) [Virgibacillus natechei]
MSQEKIKCAIIGSGNIGTDLMYKLLRSEKLEVTALIGIDSESKGLQKARENGVKAIDNGIDGLKEDPDIAEIVFEATSAKAHAHNAPILKEMGKKAIDLTPAAVGPFLVPSVNLKEEEIPSLDNVNMVTCGGQATIPMVKAISDVLEVDYAEIVASISSKSAGPGTRQNIDEFTVTTANALKEVGGAKESKAIITLNPADPPILMRNTIFVQTTENAEPHKNEIIKSLDSMLETVQGYVNGYRFKADPVVKENIVTVSVEVEGNGDFLPKYAGNLDIITSASVKTGEIMAESLLKGEAVK